MHRSLVVCAPIALLALAVSSCGGAAMYDQKEPPPPPPHGGGNGYAMSPAPTATAIAPEPEAPSFMRVGEIAPAPTPPAAPIVTATAAATASPVSGIPPLKDTKTKNFSTGQTATDTKPDGNETPGGNKGSDTEASHGPQNKKPEAVRAAVVDSTSGLTEAEVRGAIVGRQSSFRECYDLGGANFSGSVSLRVSIGPSGSVANVDVVASTTKSNQVDSCVAGAVRRIQFPAKGAGAVVAFPIEFGR